jgi:hypothetical protein
MGYAAVGAAVTLAADAAITTFAGGPIGRTVGPMVAEVLGREQTVQVFYIDPESGKPFTVPDAEYAISLPRWGDGVNGYLTRRVNGEAVPDQRSELIGFQRDGSLVFSYQTLRSGVVGVGSFFGKYDWDTKTYVGTLTGYARDEGVSNPDVSKFVAVVGDDKMRDHFLQLANAAYTADYRSNKPGSGDLATSTQAVVATALKN